MEETKPQKPDQVLILSPKNELHFKAPFEEIVTKILKLTNPTDKKICFKVKTTAPKRYCVRPNSGFIDPFGTVNVAVMLQPLQQVDHAQIAAEFKSKHKFMIQSVFVEESCTVEPNWKDVDPMTIMDSKLRCVFEFQSEQESALEATNGDSNATTASTLMTSATSILKSDDTSSVSSVASANLPTSTTVSTTNASSQESQTTVSSSTREKDLLEKNQKLKEELDRLRKEIASGQSELRLRNVSNKGDDGLAYHSASSKMEQSLRPTDYLTNSAVQKLLALTFFFGLLIGSYLF